jgi:two-component system, NarL family, nitrate/nitrite response regulator NarL
MAIKLVLADDHPVVLAGLEALFTASNEFTVMACCPDGSTALDAIRRHRPDVAVLDIRMPRADGLDVVRRLNEAKLPTRIVLLTIEIDDVQALEAIRLGVSGVLLKHMASRLLKECVRKVHAGGFWVEQESLRRVVDRLLTETAAPEKALTATEGRIVRLVSEHARNKEIAERLQITESTVKNHLHAVYTKLNVTNRKGLLAKAKEWRLV